jgi:type III secretory pathway component EscV
MEDEYEDSLPCNMEPFVSLEPYTIISELITQALRDGVNLRCILCGGKVTSNNVVVVQGHHVIHEDCFVNTMCDNERVIQESIKLGIMGREEISKRLKKYPVRYVLSKLRWAIKKQTGVRLPPIRERTFKELLEKNKAITETNESALIDWFKTANQPTRLSDDYSDIDGAMSSSFTYFT